LIQLLGAAIRDDGVPGITSPKRFQRATTLVFDFICTPQINLRPDAVCGKPLQVGRGHPVLSAGPEVTPPPNGPAVGTPVATDVSEVEAPFEGMMAFVKVVDHHVTLSVHDIPDDCRLPLEDRQTQLTFQVRADTRQPVISAASGFSAQVAPNFSCACGRINL
jgi:hypothetical protein